VIALPLELVVDEETFGGKAVSLGAAIRAGLPVPPGMALSADFVERIAAGDGAAIAAATSSPHLPAGRLAVRSSAIGEDSAGASFAGQHATCLNIRVSGLASAIYVVWESARTDAARAYRERLGLSDQPAIGVVVQKLIEPVAAGVLFTRDPLTGANERVIEAAWGLGEAVVSGQVIPDRFRLDCRGRVLERIIGTKDVKIWYDEGEGTKEHPVPPELHEVPCLEDDHLDQLHALAERCERVWGTHLDLEWALDADGAVYLLQSRPITSIRS
jgi:pyruvate,water dikinase